MLGELPVDWKWAKFETLLDQPLRNGIYKKKEFHGSGCKIVNMGELFANPRIQRGIEMKRVELTEKEVEKSTLREGDLIFARRSLTAEGAGKCCVILSLDEPTTFESSIIRARLNQDIANPEFYYYLFNSPFGKWLLGTILRQVAVAGITGGDLAKLEVPVPPKLVQDKIADRGRGLDDKIELNRQINNTLESMAQALFKSWFVDFDPVIDNALAAGNPIPDELQARAEKRRAFHAAQAASSGEASLPTEIQQLFPSSFVLTEEMGWVPEGWTISPLEAITLELRRGISPKYTDEGGVRVVNQRCIRNHLVDYTLTRRNDPQLRKIDGRELHVGDVLVNSTGVGTLGRIAQVLELEETTVVDSHVTVVRPNSECYLPYTFGQMMLSLERRIEAMGEGSTGQTELSRKSLQEFVVMVPDVQCQKAVEPVLVSIAEKIVTNTSNSIKVAEVRDLILPKLLSGKLQVPDARKQVDEVL